MAKAIKSPRNLYVRWLGAFRHKSISLLDSLVFEFNRDTECACERISARNQGRSFIEHARVGLLFRPTDISKTFEMDCWSEYDSNGKLYKTRSGKHNPSSHAEAWVKANACPYAIVCKVDMYKWDYKGDVLRNGFYGLRSEIQAQIKEFVSQHPEVKVYNLKGMSLKEVPLVF